MSLSRCARRQPTADADALAAAVASVCERSFFALVEPAGPAHQRSAALRGRWYDATVDFDGSFAGRFRVTLPASLAHELFTSFLGCDDGEPIEEGALVDLLGEFANMACGRWLTGLTTDECFALAPPAVQRAEEPAPGGAVLLAVNDQPVIVAFEPVGAR